MHPFIIDDLKQVYKLTTKSYLTIHVSFC